MHKNHYGDLTSPKWFFVVVYTNKMGQGAFIMILKGSYKGNLCAVKVLHHHAIKLKADVTRLLQVRGSG